MQNQSIASRADAIRKGYLIPLGDKASIESGLIYPIMIGAYVEYRIDDVTDCTIQDYAENGKVSAWLKRSERHDNMLSLLRRACEQGLIVDSQTEELDIKFDFLWHGIEFKAEIYADEQGLPAWLIWTAADIKAITKNIELV